MAEMDLEKLLGGFATDTLTPEERQALFTAALNDQQLFNTLADEQALKELLADPAVRRRLLQTLEQTNASRAAGALFWLDWFRRPSGLGWAGGLAAASLAVVLGTKIYQDSLREAAQSVQSEAPSPTVRSAPTSPPSPPSVLEPPRERKENVGSPTDVTKPQASPDRPASKKEASKPPTSEKDALDATRPSQKPAAPTDRRSSKAGEGTDSLAAKKKAELRHSAPVAGVLEPKPMPPVAVTPPPDVAERPIGARTLFYSGESIARNRQAMAKDRTVRSAPDASGEAVQPEPTRKAFSDMELPEKPDRLDERLDQPGMPPRGPFGLRYSFVVKGGDGRDREVDAATAATNGKQIRLTVETNQDGYLRILKTAGSMPPLVLFPEEHTARSFIHILPGNRIEFSLSPGSEEPSITLTIQLSREPFGSRKEQEPSSLTRIAADPLVESVAPGGPSGLQERAVYVVSQDSSPAAQLSIDIPLPLLE